MDVLFFTPLTSPLSERPSSPLWQSGTRSSGKEGAELVTVSRDTKFVHLAWQRDEKLLGRSNIPWIDPTGRICRLFAC